MSEQNITSLKQHALRYAVIIFVVMFLAAFLHYLYFSSHLLELEKEESLKNARATADSLENVIHFYQKLNDRMAQQHEIFDLIQFGEHKDIHLWAKKMQRIVPDIIGIAVFDKSFDLKGNRSDFRLGKSCVIDFKRQMKGELHAAPPVHIKTKGLEHFDIYSPVSFEGEFYGMLFSSFSLKIFETFLAAQKTDNRAYRIISGEGIVIAETKGFAGDRPADFSIKIENTDWKMEMNTLQPSQNFLISSLLFSNSLAFLLVVSILYISMHRLYRVIHREFDLLAKIVSAIKAGKKHQPDNAEAFLLETQGVVRYFKHIASELSLYHEQLEQDSKTDALTGLYNRRVLYMYLEEMLDLADQDNLVYLAIIDIDFFKQTNDEYGHDTGDAVLQRFSTALKESLGEGAVCARVGGDEFIVLLPVHSKSDVEKWYQAISQRMQQEIIELNQSKGIAIEFGLSVGSTLLNQQDDSAGVLKRADEALYFVKQNGRNHIHIV